MTIHFPGKVALITGSSKGIGRGIAEALAAQGIAVVVTSRSAERADATAAEITAQGGQALGLPFNLEHEEDLDALIQQTIASYGRLDILVNNALASAAAKPLEALPRAEMHLAFSANINNTFLLTNLAYPYLKHSEGSVINVASVIVNRYLLGMSIYAMVKGAMLQMTKALAADWAKDGIRINAINPGFIRTEALSELGMPEDLIEKNYDYYKSYHALGKIGQPDDIGKLAAYLASDAANLITGAVFDVDGGFSIRGLPFLHQQT